MGDDSREPGRLPVLRWRAAIIAGGVILLLTAGALVWLLLVAGGDDPDRANARIDAIRTGFSVAAGLGGAAALLLAFRRQRSNEQAAADANHDATERRITELYTAAAEQLGNDNAPVRLAGLYALERLAQENPAHRQTIVDVICAYLRMPFAIREEPGPDELEELEVRLTAQRILADHTRPARVVGNPGPRYWSGTRINLTRATLVDVDFSHCRLNATFARATFRGDAWFEGAMFIDTAEFYKAEFASTAWFGDATFSGDASFDEAHFAAVWFIDAAFAGDARFGMATFTQQARFDRATLVGAARFGNARTADSRHSVWLKGWRIEPDPDGGPTWLVWDDDSAAQVGEDGADPPVVGG